MRPFTEKELITVLSISLHKRGIDPDIVDQLVFDRLKEMLRDEILERYGVYIDYKQYNMSCFKEGR